MRNHSWKTRKIRSKFQRKLLHNDSRITENLTLDEEECKISLFVVQKQFAPSFTETQHIAPSLKQKRVQSFVLPRVYAWTKVCQQFSHLKNSFLTLNFWREKICDWLSGPFLLENNNLLFWQNKLNHKKKKFRPLTPIFSKKKKQSFLL